MKSLLSKKHYTGIDFIKGCLILFVIAGHILQGSLSENPARYMIYGFHMPLFVAIYFTSEKPYSIGLPNVAYCARELHFSAKYFGDLIKKETGISAQEYIQSKIIDVAKNKIFGSDKTVSEIAYELGFKYPQHFTRLFKKRVGYTPNEFRLQN